MTNARLKIIWIVALASQAMAIAQAQTNLLRNGRFDRWENSKPLDWAIDIGAGDRASKMVSQVSGDASSGLALSGDRSTRAWRMVSQELPLKPGQAYQLKADVLATGVVREKNQFDNCYVGVLFFGERSQRLGLKVEDVSSRNQMSTASMSFRVPEPTTKSTVVLFLSKTGKMVIRSVSVERLVAGEPFDELIAGLRSQYSFTKLKDINWNVLEAEYSEPASKAKSVEDFAKVVIAMLSKMRDVHVWVEMPNGDRKWTSASSHTPQYSKSVIRGALSGYRRMGLIGGIGRMGQVAYVSVDALPSDADYKAFISAMTALKDVSGMIIDLRRNGGGNENRAKEIAGCFTSQTIEYARAITFEDGRASSPIPRTVMPGPKQVPAYPVVCFIDGGCVSSLEGIAFMFKAIDRVTVIGSATRGASGNPRPIELSNGLKVWFSRWVSTEIDGTPIEGRGVSPEIDVKGDPSGDAALMRALEILKAES
ncbi:MAG: S41 family peptidase [Planctomycetota bacterium]